MRKLSQGPLAAWPSQVLPASAGWLRLVGEGERGCRGVRALDPGVLCLSPAIESGALS